MTAVRPPGRYGALEIDGLTFPEAKKMLAERFGMKFHNEKREMPAYVLTVGKGGQKMTPGAGDPNGLMDEEDHDNGGL